MGNDCVHLLLNPVLPSSDTDVCEALVQGAMNRESTETRVAVLGALWSLAVCSETDAVSLWGLECLRKVVLTGAVAYEPKDVRDHALGALWAFSIQDVNKERIW